MEEGPMDELFNFRRGYDGVMSTKSVERFSNEAREEGQAKDHGKDHANVIGTHGSEHEATNIDTQGHCHGCKATADSHDHQDVRSVGFSIVCCRAHHGTAS